MRLVRLVCGWVAGVLLRGGCWCAAAGGAAAPLTPFRASCGVPRCGAVAPPLGGGGQGQGCSPAVPAGHLGWGVSAAPGGGAAGGAAASAPAAAAAVAASADLPAPGAPAVPPSHA